MANVASKRINIVSIKMVKVSSFLIGDGTFTSLKEKGYL